MTRVHLRPPPAGEGANLDGESRYDDIGKTTVNVLRFQHRMNITMESDESAAIYSPIRRRGKGKERIVSCMWLD